MAMKSDKKHKAKKSHNIRQHWKWIVRGYGSKDTWSQKHKPQRTNNSIHQKMNSPFISLDVCAWQFKVLLIIYEIEHTYTKTHNSDNSIIMSRSIPFLVLFFCMCCISNCKQLVPHRRFICLPFTVRVCFIIIYQVVLEVLLMEISMHGNTYRTDR